MTNSHVKVARPASALGGAADRDARIAAATKQLEQLCDSAAFRRWLDTRRWVHNLSWANQALISQQAALLDVVPDRVQAAWRWRKAGFFPAKGSTAFYIWTFRSRRRKDGDWVCCAKPRGKARRCEDCGKADHYFKLGPVFAASQVVDADGQAPPPAPAVSPIEGDDLGPRLEPLEAWARDELGYRVEYRDLTDEGAGGWCDTEAKLIVIDGSTSVNEMVATLVHELAHAMGITYRDRGRGEAELIVEATTYVVCQSIGLDTSGRSIPYVAGWAGEGAVQKMRDAVSTIDELAKRLEAVLLAEPDPVAA
jgi:hypothetical protein